MSDEFGCWDIPYKGTIKKQIKMIGKVKGWFFVLWCCNAMILQAQITIDANYTTQALIKDVLINSPCANIDKITSTNNSVVGGQGFNSIGYFNKSGSDFPFKEGMVLTTSNVSSSIGPNNYILREGNANWKGDIDIANMLQTTLSDTYNASVVEFEFTPLAKQVSFRYLMASEEYFGNFPCTFADGFAFILSGPGIADANLYDHDADPSTPEVSIDLGGKNIALIPGTNIPVNVTNIHNVTTCPAGELGSSSLPAYYDTLLSGSTATNYNGQTVVLTAKADVIPNATYTIKLVIAERTDHEYDSAVFLEAGSFNLGSSLGDDLTIATGNPGCQGTPITLNADIGIAGATYKWSKDGVVLPGQSASALEVSTNGVYAIAIDAPGGCTAADSIEVEFVTPPVIATKLADKSFCITDTTGQVPIDFSLITPEVLASQDPALYQVSYHKTQQDALQYKNPLTAYAAKDPKNTLWVRIADKTQTCYAIDSFDILLFEEAKAQTPTDIILCDDALDADAYNGKKEFNLEQQNALVLGSLDPSYYNVSYYKSMDLAQKADPKDALPYLYTNTDTKETIYARVTHIQNANCYAISSFKIEVKPIALLKQDVVLKQCDTDTDGITVFNLQQAESLLFSSAIAHKTTFYTSLSDAQNNTDPITTPTAYTNKVAGTDQVYARVTYTESGCYAIARVELKVGTTQVPSTFKPLTYFACDNDLDGDATNGVSLFNFEDATAVFKALFSQKVFISYYQSQADALSEVNAIDPSSHTNTASAFTQDIYVRIDSQAVNACLGLGPYIHLEVVPLPLTTTISDYTLCSTTATAQFNLDSQKAKINAVQKHPMTITYYASLSDAQNNTAALPYLFTNTTNPQTIYTRCYYDANANGKADPLECVSTAISFKIEVTQTPELANASLTQCSSSTAATYDLTQAATTITKGNTDMVLSYFANAEDLNNNNPIANASAYVSDALTKTIFVEATALNGCKAVAELALQTYLYDAINTDIAAIEECEVDNDGFDVFDLTLRESAIVAPLSVSDFIFTYYTTASGALAQTADQKISFPKTFTNTTASSQTVYANVSSIASGCSQVVPIVLQVNPVPEIAIKKEYLLCLQKDNITPVSPVVIETYLDPSIYEFTWFKQEQDASLTPIAAQLSPAYSPTSAGVYMVEATHKTSRCRIQATTTVTASYVPGIVTVSVTTPAFSDRNTVSVTVEGSGVYQYQLDTKAFQKDAVFYDVLPGMHTITVRDIHHCDSVTKVMFVVGYPKFFTPNGDGYNDTWNIYAADLLSNLEISIFDRYGKLLYQTTATGSGWDGTYKGKALPAADYWFVIKYKENNVERVFKKHFSLKR